jgi:hypothetical protein
MSITGPLHPEQLTRGETLDEVCVGPEADFGVAVQPERPTARSKANGLSATSQSIAPKRYHSEF